MFPRPSSGTNTRSGNTTTAESRQGGPSQIFRLESPAAVFHYRGEPHLHAFVNVAQDGERALSIGEVVATNPTPLESGDVRALFERVLRETTGATLAYFPSLAVPGRLRAAPIRTGDLYNLESWATKTLSSTYASTISPPPRDPNSIGGDGLSARPKPSGLRCQVAWPAITMNRASAKSKSWNASVDFGTH